MAVILSLETSSSACSVALHESGRLMEEMEVVMPQQHASQLAPLIEEVLRNNGVKISALAAVAVSAGPGSYTGLRIGTSTAKGICFGGSIPLIGIATSLALAHEVGKVYPEADAFLCPMIDAKRMEVYCEVFDRQLNRVVPLAPRVIDNTTFFELLERQPVLFFGDGAEKCKSVISHANAKFLDGFVPRARFLGEMAFEKFLRNEVEDLMRFTPLYMKDFIAKKAHPIF